MLILYEYVRMTQIISHENTCTTSTSGVSPVLNNFDAQVKSSPTWIKEHSSFQIRVLLRTDIYTPALLQESFDSFDLHDRDPGCPPALAVRSVALPVR